MKFIVINNKAICIDEIKWIDWDIHAYSIDVMFKDGTSTGTHYPDNCTGRADFGADLSDLQQKIGLVDENYEWVVK